MTPKIGVQLYAVKEPLRSDPWGTLERLAEIGFEGVETAFYENEQNLGEHAARIRDLGMEISAIHADLPLGAARENGLRQLTELGASRLIYHGGYEEDRFATRAGIEQTALEIAAAHRTLADHGATLGLHTEWWEPRLVDGVPGYRLLDELIDPSITWEVDVYWAQVAGADPAAMVRDLGARVTALHVQDGTGAGVEQPQLPLGRGVVDLPAAIDAAAHAEWLVFEVDTFDGDVLEAAEESYRFLADHLRTRAAGAAS